MEELRAKFLTTVLQHDLENVIVVAFMGPTMASSLSVGTSRLAAIVIASNFMPS
jgi:hypothetical protein